MSVPQYTRIFTQDINKRIETQYGGGLVFSGDNNSMTLGVLLFDDETPLTTPSVDVSGLAIRADGATVVIDTGSIEGNLVSVTLGQACFEVSGPLAVTINISDGTNRTTVLRACFTVTATETGTVVDPAGVVPSLEEIQALAASMRGTVAADAAYRAHLTGLRTLTDTATVLGGKIVRAGGSSSNVGKISNATGYQAIIVPVPSGTTSLAYTRLMTPSDSAIIGTCFWDGVATDDYPYGAVVGEPETAIIGEGTVEEWRTSIISVPTGAVYAGFTWRVALGLENFNVMDATAYVRSLEGRVGELEADAEALQSWKNRTSDICTIDDPPQDDQTYMLTFKWQSKTAGGTTVWLPQIEWKLIS